MTAAGKPQSRPARIALTVDLAAGQTLGSYLSALASRNGLRSIDRFCVAFDLDAHRLRAGQPDAVAAIAKLVSIPVERLIAAGMRRQPLSILQGLPVDAKDIGRPDRVCPRCLAEDHAEQSWLRYETAARYRGAWAHNLVQACAAHDLRLVDLPQSTGAPDDLAVRLRELARTGQSLSETSLAATPVERYIHDRLRGKNSATLLDAMSFGDALFVCEYLGAPHRAGVKPRPAADIRERLDRANLGFSYAARGAETLAERLLEIAVTVNPLAAAEIGLRRVFMGLFDRVKDRTDDDMLALRQMLVDIGASQCLIAFDQTEVLGLPVPPRDRQSIESAVKKFGVSDRELRAILIELKAIPSDERRQPPNSVLFEVQRVSDILSKIGSSLNLAAAARLLGVHTQQLLRISEAGLLVPFFTRPSNDLKPLRYYLQADVEQFLARLTARCSLVRQAGELVDIWEAGLKTCRQPMEIIAAIHAGKIARTYRTQRNPTLRDILVDVAEVRASILDTTDELVSAEDCSRILTINLNAMRKILHAGFLAAEMATNPVNQRRQLAARREAVRTFQREFVSLNALRQELRSSSAGLARVLHRVGIRPAFPLHVTDVSIFRRADLARAQKKIDYLLCGTLVIRGCGPGRTTKRGSYHNARV